MNEKELQANVEAQLMSLGARVEPDVTLTVSGTDYALRANNRAMINIQKLTGRNVLLDGLKTADLLGDPLLVGIVIHELLRTNHPQFTLDDVHGMLDVRYALYTASRIMKCMELFYPEEFMDPTPKTDGDEMGNSPDPH